MQLKSLWIEKIFLKPTIDGDDDDCGGWLMWTGDQKYIYILISFATKSGVKELCNLFEKPTACHSLRQLKDMAAAAVDRAGIWMSWAELNDGWMSGCQEGMNELWTQGVNHVTSEAYSRSIVNFGKDIYHLRLLATLSPSPALVVSSHKRLLKAFLNFFLI